MSYNSSVFFFTEELDHPLRDICGTVRSVAIDSNRRLLIHRRERSIYLR